MNTNTSLGNALVSFLFSGVMAPHRARTEYEAPRVVSQSATKRNEAKPRFDDPALRSWPEGFFYGLAAPVSAL